MVVLAQTATQFSQCQSMFSQGWLILAKKITSEEFGHEKFLRLGENLGAWFSYQIQPPVATAPLHSPN